MPGMTGVDPVRLAAFYRMRRWATGLLVVATGVFLAVSLWGERWAFSPLVIAFAEAAMVGGLADWFAVTALFRQPLGISSAVIRIPHTEIIPRNKVKIGQGLGKVVVENFLTPEGMGSLIRQENPAARIAGWLERPENVSAVVQRVQSWLPLLLEEMNREDVRAVIGQGLARALRTVPVAPIAGNVLLKLREEGYQAQLITLLVKRLQEFLAKNQFAIRQTVKERSSWWVPSTMDDYITKQIVVGVGQVLQNLTDPANPQREKLEKEILVFIRKLQTDPALREAGNVVMERMLGSGTANGQAIWEEIYHFMKEDIGQGSAGVIGGAVEKGVNNFAVFLSADKRLQAILNRWLKGVAVQIVSGNREKIVDYFMLKVSEWEDRKLIEVSEAYVGRDLQYIRINGTLVGGLVGLVLYGIKQVL